MHRPRLTSHPAWDLTPHRLAATPRTPLPARRHALAVPVARSGAAAPVRHRACPACPQPPHEPLERPAWPHPGLPAPSMEFSPIQQINQRASASLAAPLQEILQHHLATFDYDRLVYTANFLTHLDRVREHLATSPTPSTTLPRDGIAAALATFRVDSRRHAQRSRSGNCYTQSAVLAATLKRHHIHAYVVVAKDKVGPLDAPTFSHAAVVVPFANPERSSDRGFFLLEPGYSVAQPLLIRLNGNPCTTLKGGETWSFAFHPGKKGCDKIFWYAQPTAGAPCLDAKPPKKVRSFRLEAAANGDAALTVPYTAIDLDPFHCRRDRAGHLVAWVQVLFGPREILFKTPAGGASRVPFDVALESDDCTWVPEEAAALLNCKPVALAQQLRRLISRESDLALLKQVVTQAHPKSS